MIFKPCLSDRYFEGGDVRSEYFWQDLIVARWIFEKNPTKHVDIGSRVDGFVAHVASYREIEVFDFRLIKTEVPGIKFIQADLMDDLILNNERINNYADSLSCLHALEHFGLGRYGDPVDTMGFQKGLFNMSKILKKGGIFYLSTPIGRERVEFNANRVFDPQLIITLCSSFNLILTDLITINNSVINKVKINNENLLSLSLNDYSLGIFIFTKN